jgi:amino acid transporter
VSVSIAPTSPPPSGARGDRGALGEPRLTTWHAVAQSLAIGPIYSAAIYGAFVAGIAGGVGPAVVVITSVGALALGWVVAQYARRFAGAGAVYEYVRGALGRRSGVAASLGYGYSLLFLGPPFLVPAGLLFQTFAKEHLGFDPGWWLGGVGAMVIVFTMQSLGIALSVRAQLTLTALSAIPIALLAVVILIQGGADGNHLSVFNPSDHTHGDVFRAILFAVTLFVGFEAAAALGEETADPHRSIPRAVLGTVAMTAGWFIVVIYAGTIGFGPAHAASGWGSDPNGLATLAHRYVGSGDATLIELAVLLDMLAVWMALTNSFSRVAYALARDDVLPGAFARTSRRGVPWVGNLTWVAVTLAMLLATAVAHVGDRFTMLSILVLPGLLIVQAIYALLAVAAVRLIRPGWGWLVLAVAAAVPGLGIYGTIHPFPAGPVRWGVWLALIGVGLCAAWFGYLQLRRSATPDPIGQAERSIA